MNDIVELNQGHMVEANYFESYGNQAAQVSIVGQLLKFSKGDWLYGQNSSEMKPGTHLVAIMDQAAIGWIRWEDNKPSEQIMGLIVDGFQPPKRKDLGDSDESMWEIDDQGRPRDPWQFTNTIVFRKSGLTGEDVHDDANMYTFSTSSRGGLNAVGELCKAYGKNMRQRPNEYPVVELAVDSYNHPNKSYGRIKIPQFNLVGWENKEPLEKIADSAPKTKKSA